MSQAVPVTNYVTIKLVSLETYFIIKYQKQLYFAIIETFPQNLFYGFNVIINLIITFFGRPTYEL